MRSGEAEVHEIDVSLVIITKVDESMVQGTIIIGLFGEIILFESGVVSNELGDLITDGLANLYCVPLVDRLVSSKG